MEKIPLKSFTLEGNRVSLKSSESLRRLEKMYPKAFNLRESLTRSTPMWWNGKPAILYEIKQDNAEHWPVFHYVLFFGGEFVEVFKDSRAATLIDVQGLFFITRSKDEVLHIGIFENMGRTKRFSIPSGLSYAKIKISSLRMGEFGIYILAKEYQGKNLVCYARNEGKPGVFADREFYIIDFPDWKECWEPGYLAGFTYFSDATSIYSIQNIHGKSTIKRVFTPESPLVRLGETHQWKCLPPWSKSKFLIIDKKRFEPDFMSSTNWLEGFPRDLHYEGPWATLDTGFLGATYLADKSLYVRSFTKSSDDDKWEVRVLLKLETDTPAFALTQINADHCFLTINGEHFLISKEHVA